MTKYLVALVLSLFSVVSQAACIGVFPYNIVDGTLIDAVPVMGNFNYIQAQVNSGCASLSGGNTFTGNQNINGILTMEAGTVGAPSVVFGTDTTTGFYQIGANHNGYAVSGSNIVDISASGVGVTGTVTGTSFSGAGTGLTGTASGLTVGTATTAGSTGYVVPTLSSANTAFPVLFSGVGDIVNYGAGFTYDPSSGALNTPSITVSNGISTQAAGYAQFGTYGSYGGSLIGNGSSYDLSFFDNAGNFAAGVPHGTQNFYVNNNLIVNGSDLYFNSVNTAVNTAYPILFSTGSADVIRSNSSITINPSTNTLTANITGNAVTCSDCMSGSTQTWNNMTGSRSFGTSNYSNGNAYPIEVMASITSGGAETIRACGVKIGYNYINGGYDTVSFIVPAGCTYGISEAGGGAINYWAELY